MRPLRSEVSSVAVGGSHSHIGPAAPARTGTFSSIPPDSTAAGAISPSASRAAIAKAPAVAKRSSGDLARALRMAASRARGASGRLARRLGAGTLRCAHSRATPPGRSNGTLPVMAR